MKRIQCFRNLLIIALPGIVISFSSCEKPGQHSVEESIMEKSELGADNLPDRKKYNEDLLAFTTAVASALRENSNLRTLVKEEATKMFDGDYDVLMSDFKNVKVKPSLSSAKYGGEVLVGDLLQSYIKDSGGSTKGTSGSIIDELIARYPFLQISVPVNAEKWDTESYIPAVTFLPFDYDESTKELEAIDFEGKSLTLDAVNPPEEPVIVVGMNERIAMIEDPGEFIVPPDPYDLTGIITESGIRLMWKMPISSTSANTSGYYVYRKSAQDVSYNFYAHVSGVYNRTFDDNVVEVGKLYSYYVIAYYFMGDYSGPSNFISVTAPLRPRPVLSFDAIQHAVNEVELRWQNDNSQFIQETRLYKYVQGIDNTYSILGIFSPDDHEYFDRNITVGEKTIYKVVHYTPTGESNPKYDFIQAPYRDLSQHSPVFIKVITFNDWRLERWPAGKPEFYINVSNVDRFNKSPFIVQDEIDCQFGSLANIEMFKYKKVLDWEPGFWYDMLTFTAVEYDRSWGSMDVTVGVGFNMKDALKSELMQSTGSSGINYTYKIHDEGEKCGSAYLDYFDNPETWLEFPNYGLKILVSESDF